MSITRFIRDIGILCVSALGVSILYRNHLQKNAPLVRVLVFHDVQDASWFENVLRLLTSEYHIVSPEDVREGRFHTTKINVLVTFDDGYASWVTVCAPLLTKYKVQALFFVNSGLADNYGDETKRKAYVTDRLLLGRRDTISWDGVRTLVEGGHTIGGHTVSHVRLSELPHDKVNEEIEKDKIRIETETKRTLWAFAYPFGNTSDYTNEVVESVKRVGYTHAYTTEGVFVKNGDSYRISRMCVEDNQTITSLKHWISGGYDIYRMIKKLCVR